METGSFKCEVKFCENEKNYIPDGDAVLCGHAADQYCFVYLILG